MLIISLLIVVSAICGFLIGSAFISRLAPSQFFDRFADKSIMSTWLGILILINGYFTASLFSPLTPAISIGITLALVTISLLSQRNNAFVKECAGKLSGTLLSGFTALAIGVGAYCSQVIVSYDTKLYHMQAVKWLSEYGLVHGMALIHSRFGYPSSWFAFAASVNHGILQGRVGSFTGGFCLFMLLIHLLISLRRIIRQRGRVQDIFIAVSTLTVLIIILVYGLPNSPTPDLPVIILVIVTAWSMLIISDSRPNSIPNYDKTINVRLIPLLLAAGAVAIKLSALPILIVSSCFYLLKGKFRPVKLIISGIILIFFLAPLGAAGIITSGCAFYPLPTFCMDLPWSPGATQAAAESQLIRDWARWGGKPTPDGATSWNWIIPWFTEEKVCSLFLALSVFALIILMISYARRNSVYGNRYVVILALTGIAFMFYAAPTWRFGLGYLVMLPALAAAGHAAWLMQQFRWLQGKAVITNWGWVGGVTALAVATHVYIVPRPTFRALEEVVVNKSIAGNDHPHFNFMLPPRIWNIQFIADALTGKKTPSFEDTIVRDMVGDFMYYRPEHPETFELCGDSSLPCAIGKLYNLRLRDPIAGLSGGFVRPGAITINGGKSP
jgi:hypothetical protein